jgi:hypothetical protein
MVTTKTHESRKKCFFCGGKFPHQGGRTKCPAWGKECKICNKPNHFAKCCKGSSNQKKIRTIDDKEDSDPSSDSSDNTSIYNVGTVNSRATDVERSPVRTVKIDNKDINVLIDTEATANIMARKRAGKYLQGSRNLKRRKVLCSRTTQKKTPLHHYVLLGNSTQ